MSEKSQDLEQHWLNARDARRRLGVSRSTNVALGAGAAAGLAGAATTDNVCLGAAAGRDLTGATNTLVGAAAGAEATTATRNTAIGAGTLRRNAAADNVAVGHAAGERLTGAANVVVGSGAAPGALAGGENVLVGALAAAALAGADSAGNAVVGAGAMAALATGSNNVLVGRAAGAAITAGSNNVVLGGWPGPAGPLSNTVVIATGDGTVLMRWDPGANAVQRLDAGTLAFGFSAALPGLTATTVVGGTTRTVELTNERPVRAALTASTTLDGVHRNRLTPVLSANPVTVTLVAYPGIVDGAEHEFLNRGTGAVTFTTGAGATLESVDGLVALRRYGAAVVKHLGNGLFALIGALE
jgi:hypothetical protein